MLNRIGQMLLTMALVVVLLAGCTILEDRTEKVKDLNFNVLTENEIPEELRNQIEEKKENVFKLTWSDDAYLYICVGYGAQNAGGYSVTVNDLYLTANAIYIDTTLLAPDTKPQIAGTTSYPYVCVKLEYIDKTVVFD